MSKSQSQIFSRLQYFSCIVYVRKVKTTGYGRNLSLMVSVYLNCTNYEEINIRFSHGKKIIKTPKEYDMNSIHKLSTGSVQKKPGILETTVVNS